VKKAKTKTKRNPLRKRIPSGEGPPHGIAICFWCHRIWLGPGCWVAVDTGGIEKSALIALMDDPYPTCCEICEQRCKSEIDPERFGKWGWPLEGYYTN